MGSVASLCPRAQWSSSACSELGGHAPFFGTVHECSHGVKAVKDELKDKSEEKEEVFLAEWGAWEWPLTRADKVRRLLTLFATENAFLTQQEQEEKEGEKEAEEEEGKNGKEK